MSKIAFLGLGAMGGRIVRRLIDAGHEVTVWNRSPAAAVTAQGHGAKTASTPREAASGAEYVLSMVTDDTASEVVWTADKTGAALGLAEGAIAIEISTVSPKWVTRLATHVHAAGAHFIEAPVVGTLPQAEAGSLVVFAAGEPGVFESARTIFEAYAGTVHQLGIVGQGATMKLVANMLLAAQLASVAELLGFARQSGIEPNIAIEMIASLPAASPVAVSMGRLMVEGDYAPRFTAALLAKDLRYALVDAMGRDVELPIAATSQAVFDRICAIGDGDLNVTAIAKVYGVRNQ